MLNKRLITKLSGKMDSALWVVTAKLRTWALLRVTHCSFGHYSTEMAKSRASCLDWHQCMQFGRDNSNDSNSVNRPWLRCSIRI